MLHERPCSGNGNRKSAVKALATANFLTIVIPSAVEGSWCVLLLATDYCLRELHRHRLPLALRRLEELPQLESEHSRQHVGREALDLGVQVAHHRVVVAARVLYVAFQPVERILQLLELSASLQLRII